MFLQSLGISNSKKQQFRINSLKTAIEQNIPLAKKQAENGLQSRSSKNGKTAVWHYGLKLQ